MIKRVCSAFVLFLSLSFLISCAIIDFDRRPETAQAPTLLTIQAEKYPEVFLRGRDGVTKILKILRLEGEKVVYLPAPYWNVQTGEIALDEISSIEFAEVPKRGAGPIAGFFLGYYAVGLIGLTSATYNDDYRDAMTLSALSGVACGLLGLVIEAAAHPRRQTKFYFSRMSMAEKVNAVRIIMFGY